MTTPSTMALSELAAKGADADFIKQTLQFALQRLMEMDVEALCKAAYGERSEGAPTVATATASGHLKHAPEQSG